MTSDTHKPLAMPGRDFVRAPTIAERTKALGRAHAHSRLVSWLKLLLPVAALGLVALYFISPSIEVTIGDMNASVEGISIEKGSLRMVNPKLEGASEKQGTYVVTASYAEQAVADPDTIHLTEIQAETNDSQKGWSRLTSPKGVFKTKTEQLELVGNILVAQSSGLRAQLTRADIDMKGQTVVSDQPVKVDFPAGKLDSLEMRLNMGAKEAEFRGDVRVRMQQQKKSPPDPKPEQADQSFAVALKSDEPVDISAPNLTIFDATDLAHFKGGVETIQGGSRMTSNELKIYYARGNAQDGQNEGGGQLKLIDASGNVQIEAAEGRKAQAKQLVFDAILRQLTLNEDVVISQGKSTLAGKQMISDLSAGITRFPPIGRVSGRFQPADDKIKKATRTGDQAQKLKAIEGAAQIDLSGTRGRPVDIEADSLTVNDKTRTAEFFGKVKTVQGTMTMQSRKLIVNYAGEKATAAGKEKARSGVKSIRAEGNVAIKTAEDQKTTSDWALFDATKQTVTIGGNVVLSQGDNVIKGSQLVIDLKTNRSRFVDGSGLPWKQQRVRGIFMPKKE